MALETVSHITDLALLNPTPGDPKSQGDDHLRNLKAALLNDMGGFPGAIMRTGTDGGAANAYTVTTVPALPAYSARMTVVFSPTVANTGASTINISGLGAKPLKSVAGFDLVQGDLVLGGIYAACYTGAEFRLLSVTKNYIDQLAFNPVLPAQQGNKGKFLRTDGVSAYWDFPGIAAVNATVVDNTTLTTAYLLVPVQMTAAGKSITLPSATPLILGGPQFIIDNGKGMYSVGIRDNAGTLIMAVAAGGVGFISLKDNSTAAGVWLVTGMGLEPGLITGDVTFPTTFGTTTGPAFVAMDTNTSVHFVALAAGGFAAFVVDNAGKVVSTPVTVFASGALPVAAFKIDATRLILFTSSFAVVLTLTGASPSYSITAGTAVSFNTAENGAGAPKLAQLSATLYVSTGGLSSQALSVSGTAITVGATATTGGDQAGDYVIYPLTATTALVVYSPNTSAAVRAYVVTVTGVTISLGTAVSGPAGTFGASCMLAANKVVALSLNGATGSAVVITVTGTVVSYGAALTISTNTPNVGYTDNNATRFNPRLFPLTANSIFLWYFNATTSVTAVLTENSGVLTIGANVTGSLVGGLVAAASPTDFLAISQSGSSGSFRFTLTPGKINGNVITNGLTQQISELAPTTAISSIPAVRLSQGDYLLAAAGIQAIPVYRSNGDAAVKRGAIATPNLNGPSSYPLQAVSSNRLVLMGPSGTQLRLLNIEVAA